LGGQDLEQFQTSLSRQLEAVSPATMLHAEICESYHAGSARASKVAGVSLLARSQAKADPAKTQAESVVLTTNVANYLQHPELAEEVFGPFSVLVSAGTMSELIEVAKGLDGQLTATVHGTAQDFEQAAELLAILERKAGRLLLNGFPTGVEVCPSMNHGGPYPATTDVRFTSVGTAALFRFVRPVCYQDFPDALLPQQLQEANPLQIHRTVNGKNV
jgi:NADP-dependent aldehyde dehydrogenase